MKRAIFFFVQLISLPSCGAGKPSLEQQAAVAKDGLELKACVDKTLGDAGVDASRESVQNEINRCQDAVRGKR